MSSRSESINIFLCVWTSCFKQPTVLSLKVVSAQCCQHYNWSQNIPHWVKRVITFFFLLELSYNVFNCNLQKEGKYMMKTKPKQSDDAMEEALLAMKEKYLNTLSVWIFHMSFPSPGKRFHGIQTNRRLKKLGGQSFFLSCGQGKQLVERIRIWTDVRQDVHKFVVTNNMRYRSFSKTQDGWKGFIIGI